MKNSNKENAGEEILIYSAPDCVYCRLLKNYLELKGIPFTEKNVREKEEYVKEAVEASGGHALPVLVRGEKVIIGFHPRAIDKMASDFMDGGLL